MKFQLHQSRLQQLLKHRNIYLGLCILSLGTNGLLALVLFFSIGHERVVIVPPNIATSFWVGYQSMSGEYLAQMSEFFTQLRLTASPASITQQANSLLHYVDPSIYGELKSQLTTEANHIKQSQISTAFYPVDIQVDAAQLKVKVVGDLMTSVADVPLSPQRLTYLLTYRLSQGRLWIKSFEEIKAHA